MLCAKCRVAARLRRCAGMGVTELRRLKQLEDENASLRKLVADLSLDKHILQEIVSKKL